jgi:antitoxin VapB
MGVSIKNDKAEKLARQVATAETLIAISRRCSSLPDLDTRAADEILGYDEKGTFR